MKNSLAFTMAEVLITLGIIGIVAAMTLPGLIKGYQERQFKSAYKKAYSELSQVFQKALIEQGFTRTKMYEEVTTKEEIDIMKAGFKVLLDCGNKDIARCWKKGDTICGGSCSSGNPADGIATKDGAPRNGYSFCFMDVSGRSWCSFSLIENIYLVDTNGFSNPNQFGKDRWIFTFGDENNKRVSKATLYKKIKPYYSNITTLSTFCKHPPCYYESWLLD